MNFVTQLLHILGSGATAYVYARNMRDLQTRPNTLAAFQLAESGSVPFLETLSARAAAEGDAWLAERLASHAQDERRHGQIFAHALKQLNKQIIDFKSLAENRDRKPEERRSPFFAAYFDGYSSNDLKAENIDWIAFMGSTYILELDASQDFLRMAKALPDTDAASTNLKKSMISVANDETGHAAYLREALERRLPLSEVNQVLDNWRTRKVNALVAMVKGFVEKGGKLPVLTQEGSPAEAIAEREAVTA